jgi:hypothetical protein
VTFDDEEDQSFSPKWAQALMDKFRGVVIRCQATMKMMDDEDEDDNDDDNFDADE